MISGSGEEDSPGKLSTFVELCTYSDNDYTAGSESKKLMLSYRLSRGDVKIIMGNYFTLHIYSMQKIIGGKLL
jgi:hypothetical protein